jgi:hypothetical protein
VSTEVQTGIMCFPSSVCVLYADTIGSALRPYRVFYSYEIRSWLLQGMRDAIVSGSCLV